jgi:hypothetical protein
MHCQGSHSYFHFDARPESVDDRQYTNDGKSVQLRVEDAGEVGLRDTGTGVGGASRYAFGFPFGLAGASGSGCL